MSAKLARLKQIKKVARAKVVKSLAPEPQEPINKPIATVIDFKDALIKKVKKVIERKPKMYDRRYEFRNDGRRKAVKLNIFGEWLFRHKITYAEAGRALGTSKSYAQQFATKRAPRLATYGVDIERWTKKVDKKDFISLEMWIPYCTQLQVLRQRKKK